MSKIEIKLTIAETRYLLNLVEDNIMEGSYWGNKEQFEKRQSIVFGKLYGIVATLDNDSSYSKRKKTNNV